MADRKQFYNRKTKNYHVLEKNENSPTKWTIVSVQKEPAKHVPITNAKQEDGDVEKQMEKAENKNNNFSFL
jgi:hypothetical protein